MTTTTTTYTFANPATGHPYQVEITPEGDPVLYDDLRVEMVKALKEAAHEQLEGEVGAYLDHQGYLNTLARTPNGTVITPEHELADVIMYFDLTPDEL